MSEDKKVPGVKTYDAAAGGWGALKATAITVRNEMDLLEGATTLLRTNQPTGFDCPGCAWPDPDHKSTFQFCENGAKAVTWEATKKRATPELIGQHTVSELLKMNDHELEELGRLTHPLVYNPETDRYQPIDWQAAFDQIAAQLQALSPEQVDFYTSGRASNEASFLYQLFARAYGSNNFPDCSNMCHECTSVGLPMSLGMGKGSVSLADFDKAELLLSIGHNPGTNHPRMMGTLHDMSKRNVPIVVLNPLKERALERFTSPQEKLEMITGRSVPIASDYLMLRAGGDAAAIKGIIKAVLALEDSRGGVLDKAFIAEHTHGFEAMAENIRATSWDDIEKISGLSRAHLETVAELYAKSNATIISYGMGITQHNRGTDNVRLLCDLLLLKGNIGKPGAGICPLRGHSNVQGNRTMGITEKPSADFLAALGKTFHFSPPSNHGRDALGTLEAMVNGDCQALICLGGNFAVALPDPEQCYPAMAKLALTVHVGTKLNRSHLLVSKASYILPCRGRTEQDIQASGPQAITVEDSMSMVHASVGKLAPASPDIKSEVAIVADLAAATLPDSGIDWLGLRDDYHKIRDAIAQVIPGFENFNERITHPGGFRLPLPHADRVWKTPSGKAEFSCYKGLEEDAATHNASILRLMTLRSHDQYNTTIYSYDDRYRGVFGRRDVLFMSPQDLASHGLEHGDLVDVETALEGVTMRYPGLTVISHDMAPGSVGAYYPEANCLVPRSFYDAQSGVPSYKSVPVRVSKSGAAQ
ncbi:protein YdeP [Microbulbifer aestuariivivens]|uniref:Protein YdeP n=1 Tax=Microbulbifer aestuariivivens TaxID=1908308 RepID=A0ABP9WN98_9GAMM